MEDVYVVYGLDYICWDDWIDLIAQPDFIEVFASYDEALACFKKRCLKAAKYPELGFDPIFPDLSDEEIFVDQEERYEELYEENPDNDLFIHYHNWGSSIEWWIFAHEDSMHYDGTALPRIFLQKTALKK